MQRSQRKLGAFLLSGAAVALLLGGAGLSAAPAPKEHQGHKVDICHVPPGNPANAHMVSIATAADETHEDHGDDWRAMASMDDATGKAAMGCFHEGGDLVTDAQTAIALIGCIDRPGRSVGRLVRSSLMGLIHKGRMGCDLEQ